MTRLTMRGVLVAWLFAAPALAAQEKSIRVFVDIAADGGSVAVARAIRAALQALPDVAIVGADSAEYRVDGTIGCDPVGGAVCAGYAVTVRLSTAPADTAAKPLVRFGIPNVTWTYFWLAADAQIELSRVVARLDTQCFEKHRILFLKTVLDTDQWMMDYRATLNDRLWSC